MVERVGSMEVDGEVVTSTEEVVAPEPAPAPVQEEDPNARLWESDGPTLAQIEEWKRQYGDVYVTSVTPEKHYVWRTMSRFEYRNLVKQMEQQISSGVSQAEANMNNEEAVSELCILVPAYRRADSAVHMAGVASIICQEVMEASAFVAIEVRSL